MNIEEAKSLFKEKYSVPWLNLVDEHQEELFYKTRFEQMYRVSAEELCAYATFEGRRAEFTSSPVECCMCSKDYREQMISPINRMSYFGFRGTPLTFGDRSSGGLYVEIGEASDDFKNYFRFSDGFHDYALERISRRGRSGALQSNTLWDVIFSPVTIRVHNIGATDIQQAVRKTQSVIEGCLFNLSYLKGIVHSLDEQWPRRQLRKRPFQFEEREANRDLPLPLPKGRLNTDIIRFYQRGISTDDPVNQFLSFYQVLEYFFLSISDEELYRKLAAIVNDPVFSAKPKQLNRIIQETTNHKRESDETEMLRLVVNRYADESELIGFIDAYEEHLGEKWYTKKRRLFGEDNEVRAVSGHVVGNVAKRVKMVRNALVHSSDRYNRQETFVPSPDSEAIVSKEVPLVKYLAEKVIIANSYERS